uniref:FecR family protein n=1 Tax=Pedobacter schmidteae TaxID=2201271 RepID=UPI000EB5697B|nr:FecR domain-containing protein [Pedobacter schmidteae]
MTDELLIKFLLKETSAAESITVQNWLDADPQHQTHFLQFQKVWDSSKKLALQSNRNEEDAWARFKQKTNIQNKPQPISRKLKPNYNLLKIAAVLILVAAGWSVYTILGPVTYIDVTAGNNVATKVLPDGSELTLNKNAKISYADNFKNNRSIHMQQGEVFFNVAHNKSKPFVIDIDKISVLVVGTSFNIKHLNRQTEVIVETGIVKVSMGKNETTLLRGEKVLITDGSDQMIKAKNTDLLYNYYRSNEFVATNTPLSRMVAMLNEVYGSNVIIKDEAIKKLLLNATLKTTADLEDNLQIIAQTFDLKIVRNQNQIILSNP